MKYILLLCALGLCMFSCKSKDGYFRMPELDFRSDAYFFRAVGSAEDAAMQTAKAKAVHLAKLDIAKSMGSVMEATVKNYLGSANNGDSQDRFEQISRETVRQSLVDVRLKDLVYKREKNGNFSCIAFVEMPVQEVSGRFARLGAESVQLDKELFEQEYNRALSTINSREL